VEQSYPMGPMMGRENELMKSAVYGVFVGWWKCAATAVCSSRQGRTDKDVCGSRD
jgi:hypothetical protein